MSLAPSYEDYMEGHWSLDQYDQSTADDWSGNENHALVNHGASDPYWLYGVLSGALQFDGTSDYLTVPDDDTLDGILTYAAWVNPITYQNHATYHHILMSKHIDYRHGIYIQYNTDPNRFVACFQNDQGSRSIMTYEISCYSQWYHIAGVFKDGHPHLYVNGKTISDMQKAKAESVHPWTDPPWETLHWTLDLLNNQSSDMLIRALRMGGGRTNRYSWVKLDDCKVFSAALTDAEIWDLYGKGVRKYHLGITSKDAVEFYPINYHKFQKQERFDHRAIKGRLFQVNFGAREKINFECNFISENDAALVNSWWDSNADLRFFVQSDFYTEVNSVRLVNESKPFQEWNQAYDNRYRGRIDLEGY